MFLLTYDSSFHTRHYTEKNSPISLTVFLIKPLGNYTRTHRHTDTHSKIIIEINYFTYTYIIYIGNMNEIHSQVSFNFLSIPFHSNPFHSILFYSIAKLKLILNNLI